MKTHNPHEFYVGQSLYVPYSRRFGAEGEVTIKKIGRHWVTLSNNYRFDIKTMEVDGVGFNAPFTVWKSKNDYENFVAFNTAWSTLRAKFQNIYLAPKNLTLEKINQIISILEGE